MVQIFRTLSDMDELELYDSIAKIIEGFVWLSTKIYNKFDAETLAPYCKRAKVGRTRKQLICEYLKVKDSSFYNSNELLERDVLKNYKISPNNFGQLCSILCVERHTKFPKNKIIRDDRGEEHIFFKEASNILCIYMEWRDEIITVGNEHDSSRFVYQSYYLSSLHNTLKDVTFFAIGPVVTLL